MSFTPTMRLPLCHKALPQAATPKAGGYRLVVAGRRRDAETPSGVNQASRRLSEHFNSKHIPRLKKATERLRVRR